MSALRIAAAAAAAVALAATAGPATAAPAQSVEVQRIVPAQPSGAGPRHVGVTVFFDFSPASASLMEQIQRWAAGAGSSVVLDRQPLEKGSDPGLARGFIMAQTLGVSGSVLPGLFEIARGSLRGDQLRKALAGLFHGSGINGLEFNAAWKSPATEDGLTRARSLAERFGIQSAPAIVVNGVWRLTPAAGGPTALLEALESKVAEVSASETENQ